MHAVMRSKQREAERHSVRASLSQPRPMQRDHQRGRARLRRHAGDQGFGRAAQNAEGAFATRFQVRSGQTPDAEVREPRPEQANHHDRQADNDEDTSHRHVPWGCALVGFPSRNCDTNGSGSDPRSLTGCRRRTDRPATASNTPSLNTPAVRRQIPRRHIVLVAGDQHRAARMTMGGLTNGIADIANVHVPNACIYGDPPGHARRPRWCRQSLAIHRGQARSRRVGRCRSKMST